MGTEIVDDGPSYAPRDIVGPEAIPPAHAATSRPTVDPNDGIPLWLAAHDRALTEGLTGGEPEERQRDLVGRATARPAFAAYYPEAGVADPRTTGSAAPAHFDAAAAQRSEDRAQVQRRGGDPNAVEPRQPTPYDDVLFGSGAPWLPAEAISPGDPDQQRATIEVVNVDSLWYLPQVQDPIRALAAHMETSEPSKQPAASWLRYWHARFRASVHYILEVRPTHRYRHLDAKTGKPVVTMRPAREERLLRLRDAEAELLRLGPPPAASLGAEAGAFWAMGIVTRVEQLRDAAQAEWRAEMQQAAVRFLVVAQNEARLRTERQNARDIQIYSLPEELEGSLPASAFPALFAADDNPTFSPSTARFMAALQKTSGQHHLLAINYGGHELSNPFVGDPGSVGKYSFDLQPDIPKDSNGFYEHAKVVEFFLAMERASQETGISWTAYYNDFAVAKEVNEQLGWRRIGFSGGGGPAHAAPDQAGSFHHGPFPYILHIHVNIMPRPLAQQYFAGRVDLPLSLDLGIPADRP